MSAALSSIGGPSLDQIPADKRIYAGGGGSIRAYGYQRAGALDDNNRPIGGKSSLELSLEARIKITDTIGIVPFVDAGSYYPSSCPNSATAAFWPRAWLSLLYRVWADPLDIATPLSRRSGDSLVQFYISLGQAF